MLLILDGGDDKDKDEEKDEEKTEADLLRILALLRASAAGLEKLPENPEAAGLVAPIDRKLGYIEPLVDEYEEHMVKNGRGFRLFSHLIVPRGKVRGIVACVPGFSDVCATLWNDACLRKADMHRYLSYGLAVMSLDHVGHGRSDGMCMFISDFEGELVADAALVFAYLQRKIEEKCGVEKLPVILAGESMGGNIAIRVAQKHSNRFDAVLLFGEILFLFFGNKCALTCVFLPSQQRQ